jgi:alkaline phosphatase
VISRRAQVGWSTHGHSAVDVNIYAYSPKGSEALHGNHENTEIGDFLQNYLDLDVQPITEELVKKLNTFGIAGNDQSAWVGRIPTEQELESGPRLHGKVYGEAPPVSTLD